MNIFYKNNDEPSCTRAAIATSLSNLEEANQQFYLAILKIRNISKHCNKHLKLIEQDKLFKKRINLNDTIAKLRKIYEEKSNQDMVNRIFDSNILLAQILISYFKLFRLMPFMLNKDN